MLNYLRKILVIISLLLTTNAFSLNSSSYLIANTAVNLFDFSKAKEKFDELEYDLGEYDLQNQLLTYVNLNLISEANNIAIKIIEKNKNNQEAWIVYLANGVIKNDLSILKNFQYNKNNYEMKLLDYIFFTNNGEIKDHKLIARSIFEIVQASVSDNNDRFTYKFFLFYLSIAIMIDTDFKEAFFYSAQIHQTLENYIKAEYYYNKISNDHNLYVDSQKNIAINKSKIGFSNDGIRLLKELLNDNQNNLDLIIALADLYRVQKNYQEAINYYTMIINLKNNAYRDYWRIYYLRGICFERLKKWDLAEQDFLYSLKIKPNSPQVLNYLAYGWLERNFNIDQATRMLEKAYQANPESYYIADSLAWAFYKKNELMKAVKLMEKVIIMAPGEAISLYHLGDIYFSMNRKREASYFWKQALDLATPEDEITDILIKKLAK